MGAVPKDGRAARSYRARLALAEALLDLVKEGVEQPTAVQIAERAKVSLRLVFHHFDDLEAIYASAGDIQIERVRGLVKAVDPGLPFDERLQSFVRNRAKILEYIAPVRRAGVRLENSSQVISRRMRTAHEMARDQAFAAFAPELASFSGDDASEVREALNGVTSWEMWELLRRRSELSVKQSGKIVERLVRRLLTERK